MKKDIHPQYELAIVRCACGAEVETRTTRPGINVEICSQCHPFFTGKQKLVDTAGRVDRFRKRYGMEEEGSTAEAIARAGKAAPAKETAPKKTKAPETTPQQRMAKAKKMAAKAQAEIAAAEREFIRTDKRGAKAAGDKAKTGSDKPKTGGDEPKTGGDELKTGGDEPKPAE